MRTVYLAVRRDVECPVLRERKPLGGTREVTAERRGRDRVLGRPWGRGLAGGRGERRSRVVAAGRGAGVL
jgi:hypothetical protein